MARRISMVLCLVLVVFVSASLGDQLTSPVGTLTYGWNSGCTRLSVAYTPPPWAAGEPVIAVAIAVMGGPVYIEIYLFGNSAHITVNGVAYSLATYGITYAFGSSGSFSVEIPNEYNGTVLITPGDRLLSIIDGFTISGPIEFIVPSCTAPEAEPDIRAVWYLLEEDGSLTLTFENQGDAVGSIWYLTAGASLHPTGGVNYWLPDSDLRTVILLDDVYILMPGELVLINMPYPNLPEGYLEEAALRALGYPDFDFDPPYTSVGTEGSATAWAHLVPSWLELFREGEGAGE